MNLVREFKFGLDLDKHARTLVSISMKFLQDLLEKEV